MKTLTIALIYTLQFICLNASAETGTPTFHMHLCDSHIDQVTIPAETGPKYIVRMTGVTCIPRAGEQCQQQQQSQQSSEQIDPNRVIEYDVLEVVLGQTTHYNGVIYSCEAETK
jgi:hypothetical protein